MKKLLLAAVVTLSACSDNISVRNLSVSFIEPTNWGSKNFPSAQICRQEGGRGTTPPLAVRGIPEEANLLILEISDVDDPALQDGGLGKLGFYHTEGASRATLLPVPGETFVLPPYVFEEKASLSSTHKWPYMPPCRVRDHVYRAVVKAVRRTGSFDKQKTDVYGIGDISLGRY